MLINTDIFYQKNSNEFVQENALKEFLRRVPEINLEDADTIIDLSIDENNNLIITYLDKNKEKKSKKIVLNNEVKDPRLDDYIEGLSSGLYQNAYKAIANPLPNKMVFTDAELAGSIITLEKNKKPFNKFWSTNAMFFIQTPLTVYAKNTTGHDLSFNGDSLPVYSFMFKEVLPSNQNSSYYAGSFSYMPELPIYLTSNATSFPQTTVLTGKITNDIIYVDGGKRATTWNCKLIPSSSDPIIVKNNDVLSFSFSFLQ